MKQFFERQDELRMQSSDGNNNEKQNEINNENR